jgi:hypothetical protein
MFYISALQVEHQEVLDQIWNGIVPVVDTRSIHAVMPVALFVIACFQSENLCIHFKRKLTQVGIVHRKVKTILLYFKVILPWCLMLETEVIDSLWFR